MPGCARRSTWQPSTPAASTRRSPSATTGSSWSKASITTQPSAVLIARIAACWRKGELYQLRDEDGDTITEAEGRAACTDRFKIDPKVRASRRRITQAKALKNRVAGRGRKESPKGRSGHRSAGRRS